VVRNGVALTDYEPYIRTEELLALQKAPEALTCHELQLGRAPSRAPRARTLTAATLIAALSSAPGCSQAVNHPAVTAGIVAGTLGLATCKLASDNIGTCFLVGGGAGAFLGLVAATALWLGGDGHSVLIEEQAQPLPEDSRPRRRRRKPPVDPTTSDPAQVPASPDPASPAPANPDPASPAPASPAPASPAPASPAPASPAPASPAPASPAPASPPPASPAPASPPP